MFNGLRDMLSGIIKPKGNRKLEDLSLNEDFLIRHNVGTFSESEEPETSETETKRKPENKENLSSLRYTKQTSSDSENSIEKPNTISEEEFLNPNFKPVNIKIIEDLENSYVTTKRHRELENSFQINKIKRRSSTNKIRNRTGRMRTCFFMLHFLKV